MQQSLTSILSLFQKGEATRAGMTFVGRKKEAAQSFLSSSIEKIKGEEPNQRLGILAQHCAKSTFAYD